MKINFKFLTIASLVVASILAAVVFQNINEKPKSLASYLSIDINSSQDEVLYKLGHPTFVWKKSKENDDFNNTFLKYISPYSSHTNLIDSAKIEAHDNIKNYDYWSYQNEATSTHIKFSENNKVNSIGCFTSKRAVSPEEWLASKEHCKANGISLYEDEVNVLKKFGNPNKENIKDGVKTLIYSNLNMEIQLEKMKVITIIVGTQ